MEEFALATGLATTAFLNSFGSDRVLGASAAQMLLGVGRPRLSRGLIEDVRDALEGSLWSTAGKLAREQERHDADRRRHRRDEQGQGRRPDPVGAARAGRRQAPPRTVLRFTQTVDPSEIQFQPGTWLVRAELTIRADGGLAGIPRETLNLVTLEGLRQLQ